MKSTSRILNKARRGRPRKANSLLSKVRTSTTRRRKRQLELFNAPAKAEFGGSLLGRSATSHAKSERPLATRRPIHLVMKSKMAMGARSMLAPANADVIRRLLDRLAKKYGVKVYRYANGGNHLHMLLTIHDRTMFADFLRAASGLIARHVLRVERGRARTQHGSRTQHDSRAGTGEVARGGERNRFWAQRPYTRIATWGREWRNLVNYFRLNNLEAIGFFKHQARGRGSTATRTQYLSIEAIE